MALDLKALEQKTDAEIRLVLSELPNISAFITKVKGSTIEPIAEKLYPGLGALEQTAIDDLSFFSSVGSKTITALELLLGLTPSVAA